MADDAVPVKVRGKKSATKTERKVKTNKSHFFLTISTNQRYRDQQDPNLSNDEQCLAESVERILNNIGGYVKINTTEHSWSKDHIKDVTSDYVVELGPKTRALHAHILVRIDHLSNIHLDYKKIKEAIMSDLGLNNLYCKHKLVRASGDDWILRYIDKNL